MSPQRQLSGFIDTILLTYILSGNQDKIKSSIIDEYEKLNKKCDNIIARIKERKTKS